MATQFGISSASTTTSLEETTTKRDGSHHDSSLVEKDHSALPAPIHTGAFVEPHLVFDGGLKAWMTLWGAYVISITTNNSGVG